jgi:ABC-2 type transport system permease protein
MKGLIAVPVRLFAFLGKELVETIRRPGALFSLVIGPFLIMAIFGLGYDGYRNPLRTVVVAPPDTGLPQNPSEYSEIAGDALVVTEVTADQARAEEQLANQQVDVLVVAPGDAEERFRNGEQSVIAVEVNIVDPVQAAYAAFVVQLLATEVNREIIERVAKESQSYAVAAGGEELAQIPPEIVASPTRTELINIAPLTPGVVAFFGPAVLALILQHLAVTLAAMSLVRERTSGVLELFRIAPISSAEIIAGKVLAYGVLGAAIAAISLALLILAFNIPVLGTWAMLAAVVGLLLLASIGLGLVVAVVSDSERQTVQLSLLILLASVFFSGFVLPLEEFNAPVQAIAFLLPVTHAIRLMQDVMLRGSTLYLWELGALAAIAAVTLFIAWAALRRSMTRA